MNIFVYGSLVNLKEWENVVSKNYERYKVELLDWRYYKCWNAYVTTKPNSKFYQKGESSMLNLCKSRTRQLAPVIGILYTGVSNKDFKKLQKRENLYVPIKVDVKLNGSVIRECVTFQYQDRKILEAPVNKKYKAFVEKSYKNL